MSIQAKQIVIKFLSNKMSRNIAIQKLMSLGFTELEAKVELISWKVS